MILFCMYCNEPFESAEPKMCCSGKDCGCMGMPTELVVCSDECYNAIMNRYKVTVKQLASDEGGFNEMTAAVCQTGTGFAELAETIKGLVVDNTNRAI